MTHSMASSYRIGDYLIHSLYGRGITHVFGVPGDYILSFYDRLTKSKISVVNTCDEQGAGFAADAYARIRGLGVVCITYGVGALKVISTSLCRKISCCCYKRRSRVKRASKESHASS
jgi:indolepyruvate decarboxylase